MAELLLPRSRRTRSRMMSFPASWRIATADRNACYFAEISNKADVIKVNFANGRLHRSWRTS
jgi:hypothetical protein